MVLPAFQRVVRACLQRGSFNVQALLASLQVMSDTTVQHVFDLNFEQAVLVAWRSSGDAGAVRVFCNNWMRLSNNKTLFWVVEAAKTFDVDLAVCIEQEIQKVLDDDSVDETEKTEVRTIMENKYRKEVVPEHLSSNISVADESWEPAKLYGNFPQVTSFLPPFGHEKVKAFIRKLWRGNLTSSLLIQGESGVGKSMEVSVLMHDITFLKMLPGLEAVFWFHGYKISSQTDPTKKLKDEQFLKMLGQLFRKANLQIDDSTYDSLRDSLGNTKKYILIIDDYKKYRLGQMLSQLCLSTLCILISRNKPSKAGSFIIQGMSANEADDVPCIGSRRNNWQQPLGRTESYFADMICLSDDDDFITQLYATKYKLPRYVTNDDKRLQQIVKITCGLPLIANLISKLVNAVLQNSSEKDYKQILDCGAVNLQSTTVAADLPAIVVFNLLKFCFKQSIFSDEDRLRYYVFLFFDPGQPISSQTLQLFWKSDKADDLCLRFVNIGLAQQVDSENDGCHYSVHPYLHKAAELDSIEQHVSNDLEELRKKISAGELLECRKFNHRVTWLLTGRPAAGNMLHLAINLRNWDVVILIAENADDSALLKLCSEVNGNQKMTPLELLFKNYAAFCVQSQLAFLILCKRVSASLPEEKLQLVSAGVEVVRYLYDNKLLLQKATLDGETALTLAAKDGKLNVVQFLENHGADVNEKNANGSTALMVASLNGYLDVVEFLQNRGADVNARNMNGLTALMLASFNGHIDIVRFLCSKGADLDEKYSNEAGSSMTALMHASDNGHLEVVKFLHSQGADLNGKKTNGDTALVMASRYGLLEVVEFLQRLNADLNVKDPYGNTAVMLAAAFGHVSLVGFLHEKGADLTLRNNNGQTALMMASSKGHLDVVTYILEHTTDAEAKDRYGNTALMLACDFGHTETVCYLQSKGVHLNVANDTGYTALIMAARYGELNIVRFLHNQGVGLNAKTKEGNTALMVASINGELDVINYLCKQSADLGAVNNEGLTALMLAARYGRLEVVKYLHSQNVDLKMANKHGKTALDLATSDPPYPSGRREKERKEVADYLIEVTSQKQ